MIRGLLRRLVSAPVAWVLPTAVGLALLPWLLRPLALPYSNSSDLLRHYLPFKQVLYRLGASGGEGIERSSAQFLGSPALGIWDGWFPGWDPFTLGGHPLVADPGYGAFYPPGWIFALGGPEHVFTLFFGLHILLGAFLAARCGKALGASEAASVLIGLTYALNLKAVGTWYAGFATMIPAQAWLPGAFWGLIALMQAPAWRARLEATLGIGCCLGLQVLAGDAQLALYTSTALGGFLLLLPAPLTERPDEKRPRKLPLLLLLLLAGGVGLVLSSPLWMRTSALTAESVRAGGVPFPVAMQMSAPPAHLPGMILPALSGSDASGTWRGPDGFWETAFGPSLLVWMLVALSLFRWERDRRILPLFGLAWGVLLLTFGGYGPLAPLLYWVAPGWDHFRGPARALPLLSLLLGLLAGLELDARVKAACAPEGDTRALRRVAFGLLSVSLVGLGWLVLERTALSASLQAVLEARAVHVEASAQVGAQAWLELVLGLGGAAVVASGVWLLARPGGRRVTLAWGLVSIAAFELILQAWPHLEARTLDEILPSHPLWEALERPGARGGEASAQAGGPGEWLPPGRILDLSGALSDLVAVVHGLPVVNGMNPLILRRTYHYLQALQGGPVEVPVDRPVYGGLVFDVKAPELLSRLRVDTILIEAGRAERPASLPGFRLERVWADVAVWQQFRGSVRYAGIEQWQRENPSPCAWWVEQVRPTPEVPAEALEQVRAFEPGRQALVEATRGEALPPAVVSAFNASSAGDAAGGSATLRVLSWRPSEQVLEVQALRPGLWVLSEVYASGWSVWVDEKPEAPVIVDTLLRGVWVPAGKHVLRWRYRG